MRTRGYGWHGRTVAIGPWIGWGLAIGFAPGTAGGCTAELAEVAETKLSLQAGGADEVLRLDGAPADPAYQAEYPNPTGLDRMEVTLAADGDLVTRCARAGAPAPCNDSPFFVELTGLEGRWVLVRVFDLYGTLVATATRAHAMGSVEATSSDPSGQEYRVAPDLPGEDTPAPPSEGTECVEDEFGQSTCDSGAPPQGSECPRPELKQRFCDGVNGLIAHRNLEYRVDCSEISDRFEAPTFDADAIFDEAEPPIDGCGDVVEPVEERLEDELDEQDDFCGEIQLETWAENTRRVLLRDGMCDSSPLILDLDGGGLDLGVPEEGVHFDLLGTGREVMTAWPRGGDGLLVLDRNGNGRVDDATELFGQVTGGRSYADGFAPLRELDDNGDGAVDEGDAEFARLLVWGDRDHDGRSSRKELRSLARLAITKLYTAAQRIQGPAAFDVHGNALPWVGRFERADGRTGALIDAFLRYRPLPMCLALRTPEAVTR